MRLWTPAAPGPRERRQPRREPRRLWAHTLCLARSPRKGARRASQGGMDAGGAACMEPAGSAHRESRAPASLPTCWRSTTPPLSCLWFRVQTDRRAPGRDASSRRAGFKSVPTDTYGLPRNWWFRTTGGLTATFAVATVSGSAKGGGAQQDLQQAERRRQKALKHATLGLFAGGWVGGGEGVGIFGHPCGEKSFCVPRASSSIKLLQEAEREEGEEGGWW